MSFNIGFRPLSFKQNENIKPNKNQGQVLTPKPTAGIISPPTPQPTTPVSLPPLAGIVSAPPKPTNLPSYPIPPLAGLIAPPNRKLPNPIPENIKKPE